MPTPLSGRPHMPGYGVPESSDGVLPWSWAEERIISCRNPFVATTRPDGRPHVMPVWGVWTNDLFVFSTGISTVKSRNLLANPRVAIAFEHEGKDAVVLEGEVFLAQRDDVPGFVVAYKEKYDYEFDSFPVWGVRPVVAFGFIEDDSFAETATRWRWEL
jgi:hypothetical protein